MECQTNVWLSSRLFFIQFKLWQQRSISEPNGEPFVQGAIG